MWIDLFQSSLFYSDAFHKCFSLFLQVTCILETEVASSKVLLGILYQKLLERAVAVQCGHGPASPVFTFNEAFHVLKTSADLVCDF